MPQFEREMNDLLPGEVSEPFRTQFGWHIVQVVERREHDGTDAVRRPERVTQSADARVMKSFKRQRQLRDEAYVELRLDQ